MRLWGKPNCSAYSFHLLIKIPGVPVALFLFSIIHVTYTTCTWYYTSTPHSFLYRL